MFIGHTVFFTKREIVQFITLLMHAIAHFTSPVFAKMAFDLFHKTAVQKKSITSQEFMDLVNAVQSTKMPLPSDVRSLIESKSTPGRYYRPRYDPVVTSQKWQWGMDRWIKHIDFNFSHMVNSIWPGNFEDVISKMTQARVNPQSITDMIDYFKSMGVYTAPSSPAFRSLRVIHKPALMDQPIPDQLEIIGRDGTNISMHPSNKSISGIDFQGHRS